MHEISLMEHALEIVRARAVAAGAGRVTAVTFRVGPYSGVVPEALEFAFAALTPGTLAAGAELRIETAAAEGRCPACKTTFAVTDVVSLCPTCGQVSVERSGGLEFELTAIEVNDDV